ncbi:MAG: C39 family peptidase [Candidatus Limnocylindrales bacterium]
MISYVARGIRAFVCAVTLAGVMASPAIAEASVSAQADPADAPLTPAQEQARLEKLAVALKEEIGSTSAAGRVQAAASCPFSDTTLPVPTQSWAGAATLGLSPASGCPGHWGYVATYPRRQEQPYFCGVATVQVVANYVWRVGAAANKWTQTQIVAWTRTNGSGTSGSYESYGLNKATAGSPYVPPNWTYRNAYLSELANGGSSWHALLRTDISTYSMPQVVSVAPKDPNFGYFLHSWSDTRIKAQYAGHYIVLFGWDGVWDGTRGPIVQYDDSAVGPSGTADSDPAYDMWQMIQKTNVNKSGIYIGW